VELEDGELAVEIDHHAGKAVVLAVHEAGAVGLRGIGKRGVRAAKRDRASDAAPPEVRPHSFGWIEREHPHGDVRVGIVEPSRYETSLLHHVDDRARREPGWSFLEGAAEHPWM